MAINSSSLQETILKAIDAVVTQRNNELKLDKTVTGTIKKNVGMRDGKPIYQVQYSGGIFNAIAQSTDDSYLPNQSVYVMVPENNFSKEKIIIGRASKIQTDRSRSVVAAAVNKYSIVGANLLKSTNDNNISNIQFGLRSYHPSAYDNHGIDHRAQFLYQANSDSNLIDFSNDRLNVYKEDTTAIMIKADFLTNLSAEQKMQSGARYGLIFNFAFDNLNKSFGETNREILENAAKIVIGQYEQVTYLDDKTSVAETKSSSLLDIIEDFENSLELNNSISYYTQDNTGKIDQTIEYIQSIYNNFQNTSPELDKDIIGNIISAYLNLLNDLKKYKTLFKINEDYQLWLAEVVGDGDQKYEQFVLTSDDMIGNPFNFSEWNTQYSVFKIDLETFNHLESILFYKEGFIENVVEEQRWPIGSNGGGPDIFVKNLQIYAMNPLDNQSGDYVIKVEPSNGQDAIISNSNPNTQFRATILRKMYEDLSRNDNMHYLWFKEDSTIISSNSEGYHYLGGAGWRKLEHNESGWLFSVNENKKSGVSIQDNKAYKNNYKCIAIYEPNADDKTILSCIFSIYNEDAAIDLKLTSDIGTQFSFDAGAPLITVLINENRIKSEEFKEIGFSPEAEGKDRLYKYDWAIADSANEQVLFLDEIFKEVKMPEVESVQDAILISARKDLLKKIKSYVAYTKTGETELTIEEVIEAYKATRIVYPVSIGSSGFAVYCYLKKYENGFYYDVGSASLSFVNQDSEIFSDYRIVIENGDQVFQYDEYGKSPCSESKKDPVVVQPLKAKLFTPSGLEVENSNYTVEWIFPIEDSMLSTSDTLSLNPATKVVELHKGYELTFNIADLYNPDAYNNQITCHIAFNGKDYYKDTNLYIGKQGNNGTNGTDVVVKIDPAGADPSGILTEQPLTLYVQKTNLSANAMWNIDSSRRLNPTVNLIDNILGLKLNVYQKGVLLGSDSYKTGYPRWNLAGNPSETLQKNGKFFTIGEQSAQLQWSYDTQNDNQHYRLQNIRAEIVLSEDQTYYGFFSLPIIEYENLGGLNVASLLLKNRIAIDKKYYLKEIIYNQDGRNPVYNHNQGLKLINLPPNINKIVFKAKGGWDAQKNTSGSISKVIEDTPDFLLLLEKDNNEVVAQQEIEITNVNKEAMIYVIPNDTYNGSQTNNRIEARLYNINNDLVATVYAPIHMALNTFGLASLNAWDGNTVKIDEDNGYVMAPQVGAGEKDSNNRFTGVLMGKTETYTGGADNEKEVGLFGYTHGIQSIFLDSETGDATFGLPDGYTFNEESGTPVPTLEGDTYNEGRIELRPGAVSKIGGWRLGRRSIYYTMTPDPKEDKSKYTNGIKTITSFGYKYSGEIGPKYEGDIGTPGEKNYAAHHEKDIKTSDGGLLLSANPAYISIKGKKLGYDDINTGLNSNLYIGDSLEMQLDPQTPTLFTIFRHNGPSRAYPGKRFYLAGINDKGELIANGTATDDGFGTGTKSGVNTLKAFKDNLNSDASYVGSMFEAGHNAASTRVFLQMFRERPIDDIDSKGASAQVYITGGQQTTSGDFTSNSVSGDEYGRPISIHGQSLALYARTSEDDSVQYITVGNDPVRGEYIKKSDNEYEKIIRDPDTNEIMNPADEYYVMKGFNYPETDANIKVSTDKAQINLGPSTQLFLHRTVGTENEPNINILKTSGSFNWTVGTDQEKQQLMITAKELEETYDSISQNVAKSTVINNGKGYTLNAKDDTIGLFRKNNVNDIYSQLTLTNESATFGLPTDKSFISLHSGVDENSTWKSKGKISLISTRSSGTSTSGGENIFIHANTLGSGVSHNNTALPQIELRAGTSTEDINLKENAGTVARLLMSSSNNTWEGVGKGIPFSLIFSTSKKQQESSSTTQWLIETFTQDVKENNITISDVRYWQNSVGMNQYIAGGLKVDGPYLGQGEEKGDARGTTEQGIQMRAGIRIDASGLQYYEVPGTSLKFWQWGGIKSDVFWGTGPHSFCDGNTSQGLSHEGPINNRLGNSVTIKGPKITLQSDGRPKIEQDSTEIKYAMPNYEDVGADQAGAAANALTAAKQYIDDQLKNYMKKNQSYTIDFPNTITYNLTYTPGSINGQQVITGLSAYGSSSFDIKFR